MDFLVTRCDQCGVEKRREARPGEIVLFDSELAKWLQLQLGEGKVKSLCEVCNRPIREQFKNLFPPALPDLPESDADRGPIQ